MSEATEKLPFTAMTLSRAVKQLEAVDLFTITKDGVNKVIESNYDRWELFDKIKRIFYYTRAQGWVFRKIRSYK